MVRTIQINIRVSESLIDEIEGVSKLLKISRADWIRLAIAREAFEERNRLLAEMQEIEKIMDRKMQEDISHMRKLAKRLRP